MNSMIWMVIWASKIIMQGDVRGSKGEVREGQGTPFYTEEGVVELRDGKGSAMRKWHSVHPDKKSSDLQRRSPVCSKDKIRPRRLKHSQWEEIGRRSQGGSRFCDLVGLVRSLYC